MVEASQRLAYDPALGKIRMFQSYEEIPAAPTMAEMDTTSPRKKYYNPKLDNKLQEKMTDKQVESINNVEYSPDDNFQGDLGSPDAEHPHNLVSSLLEDGKHSPALDIDIPMVIKPSSTPGHNHVFFPSLNLDWEQYLALLQALANAGIIEHAYVGHSIRRGQTLLRANGCKKIHRP